MWAMRAIWLAQRVGQVAFVPLCVVDVVLDKGVFRIHLVQHRDGQRRAVEPEARHVEVVDGFDQQLQAFGLQRLGGKAQVFHEGLAHQRFARPQPAACRPGS
jgi:hypothetical protein